MRSQRTVSADGNYFRLLLFPTAPVLLPATEEEHMHGIIYIVGLIVVILAILSFFGLR